MLERLKAWLNPPEYRGEYTEADERILEHDNAQVRVNLETEKRLQQMPRRRFSFWFFFF